MAYSVVEAGQFGSGADRAGPSSTERRRCAATAVTLLQHSSSQTFPPPAALTTPLNIAASCAWAAALFDPAVKVGSACRRRAHPGNSRKRRGKGACARGARASGRGEAWSGRARGLPRQQRMGRARRPAQRRAVLRKALTIEMVIPPRLLHRPRGHGRPRKPGRARVAAGVVYTRAGQHPASSAAARTCAARATTPAGALLGCALRLLAPHLAQHPP